jgi:hypothetical protein
MTRFTILTLVSMAVISMSLIHCQGEGEQVADQPSFAEGDLRSISPGGPLEKGTAILQGKSNEVFIQQANSRIFYDLDISTKGAFYMKVCGEPCQPEDEGAVKFDVIAGEGTDSPTNLFGGFVKPFELDVNAKRLINVTVDVSKLAGERIDLSMRLVSEEGIPLAWTEPEFKPFPGAKQKE